MGATALLGEQTQAGVGVQIAKSDTDDRVQCKITPRLTLEPAFTPHAECHNLMGHFKHSSGVRENCKNRKAVVNFLC